MKPKTKFKQTEIRMTPEDWEVKKLGDLGELKNGINFSRNDFGKGFPIINVTNLFRGRYATINDLAEIKRDTLKNPEKYFVKRGDILFTRSSLKHSGTGQAAMVFDLPKKQTVFSGFIIRFRKNPNSKIDDNFLNYLVRSNFYREYIRRFIDGTTITNINQTFLSNLPIITPPLQEQHAIAKILSDLDSKIELLQKQNETLEKIGQAIFKHWFVDFEFPNEEGKPYKSSGGEMVYNEELGKEIPKGWRIGKLGELLKNIKEHLKPGEDLIGRKYVPIDEIPMRKFGLDSHKPIEEAKSSLIAFEKGDILFGAMRPYFHRVNFSHFRGVTRTTTMVLRPIKKEFFSFSIFYLNQEDSVKYATQHSTGSTIPYATWEKSLEKMEIIVPFDKILIKFNRLLMPFFNRIAENVEQIQTLKKIRDLLLPKLMSGKIRVPVEVK